MEEKKCPYIKYCGGCSYEHNDYEKQLEEKQKLVEKTLKGNVEFIDKIIPMNFPFYYRNKVHYVLQKSKDGSIYAGLYKEGTHDVIGVKHCLIEDTRAQKIVKTIVELMNSFKYSIYFEDKGEGLFRHILIRTSYKKHEVMVTLVATDTRIPNKNDFIKALIEKHPEIKTVVLNINKKDTSYILGDREVVLYGNGYIEDILNKKTFRISSKSFYQINPNQTAKLYSKTMEYADLKGKEIVIDAYSGTGTIGIIASDDAKEVIAVESNSEAVKDAITNAKINKVKNIKFNNDDASLFMEKLALEKFKVDVVITDPPRQGSDEKFIHAIKSLKPEKVVYISCSLESLERDLKEFKKIGYKAKKAIPVDMFPWTRHVECVTLMSRVKD